MEFYKSVFGGELFIQTIGESKQASAHMPASMHGNVMHAFLSSGAIKLAGADSMNPDKYVMGNAVMLTLNCSSEEEIKMYYEKLSEGGKQTMPLTDAEWGATFGMLTDKYGHHWMLNFTKPKA